MSCTYLIIVILFVLLAYRQGMDNNQKGSLKKHYEIVGDYIILKPFARKYVKQYHQWFVDDPELLHLTGSQPLSLQQEYQNQQSWICDTLKYTFIIFDKNQQIIGDINLFFSKWIQPNQAEINIMIAPKSQRGKGYAKQALQIVQSFAFAYYKKNEIIAKIKDENTSSIKLFEKTGYKLVNHSEHFKQVQYRKKLTDLPVNYMSKLIYIKQISVKELLQQ